LQRTNLPNTKKTITILLITCSSLIFTKKNNIEYKQFLDKKKLEITIDSFDDIKDMNINDLKLIFNQSKTNQLIEFNVIILAF